MNTSSTTSNVQPEFSTGAMMPLIFCKRCGQLADTASECSNKKKGHEFAAALSSIDSVLKTLK